MRNSFPEVTAMSQMGQKAKYSERAHVFRCYSSNGHEATTPVCRLSANRRHFAPPKSGGVLSLWGRHAALACCCVQSDVEYQPLEPNR